MGRGSLALTLRSCQLLIFTGCCAFIVSIIYIFLIVPVNPSTYTEVASNQRSIGKDQVRNPVWKPHIGQWFLQYSASASKVQIRENLHNKACHKQCSGHGVCNKELGECHCFHGYSGQGCEQEVNLECNKPTSTEWPYGNWIVSQCPTFCDKRRSLCYCGEGSKYPHRPVAESCGFSMNGSIVDLTRDDFPTIYANSSADVGWCNVDPQDFYSGKVKIKQQCFCKNGCTAGVLCEIPTECTCINQCSGNGFCGDGFCRCNEGWFGVDCSMPSSLAPLQNLPSWLRPATAEIDNMNTAHFQKTDAEEEEGSLTISVQKQHPLIYVYDLPPEFNSHLIEGSHYRLECVNRIYNADNSTQWTYQLYGSEIAIYESLLASPHRTMNGEEADYFYVPILGSCAIARADDAPHFTTQEHLHLRIYYSADMYKNAYKYIKKTYPYWNRHRGRDHIWLFAWDEGACPAPKEIWNSMMLSHWGNTNLKHKLSTTAYFLDFWEAIPETFRGDHPCYDPKKDLVLPAWKLPNPKFISKKQYARPRNERPTLFYFRGNLGGAYDNGQIEEGYSIGIRQKLAAEFGSSPDRKGNLGRQAAPDVIFANRRTDDYGLELSKSKFCGVFPGHGWSGRMEDSILHGCIPVIIQDGIHLPYENVFDYDTFAVRIREDDIPDMIKILRNMTGEEVDAKLQGVQNVWQRFVYRDAIMLEAKRQMEYRGFVTEWATMYGQLKGDDVFSTLIQVLLFKLHNDPWRHNSSVVMV